MLFRSFLWGLCPQTPGIYRFAPETGERVRQRVRESTPPLPLDRDGARVASRQRPILRHDGSSVSGPGGRRQGLSRRSEMEDFEGALEAQALPGPVVQRADMGLELPVCDFCQIGALGQVLA